MVCNLNMVMLLKKVIANLLQDFLSKYSRALGGTNSAEDKGLIEEDRIVRPENLSQIATQPAAGGNAIQDPNVAGKFPSQEVNV